VGIIVTGWQQSFVEGHYHLWVVGVIDLSSAMNAFVVVMVMVAVGHHHLSVQVHQ
jgi:hypothetical protein